MDSTHLLIALGISIGINLLLFLIAFYFRSDKLTDISYAASFATIAIILFLLSDRSWYHIVLLGMVGIWAIRLGTFLLYRIITQGKDTRFDKMRASFVQFGKFWLAQAITVWVVMLPSIFAFNHSASINILATIGLAIWAIGVVCEGIADSQKLRFKRHAAHKNTWITSGIWKYSRHPNYFGEMLAWIGIYLFAASSLPPLLAIIGILSPLLICVLLLFVSGIPILEASADRKWGDKPAYRQYKKRTSLLIPLPRKQ